MKNIVCVVASLLVALSGCSSDTELQPAGTPMDAEDTLKASRGKLTGEEGWIVFGDKKEDTSSGSAIGVNSYLWRATLDTFSFMPLASADPFGGTIITDWYEDPGAPGERFKVNALILDKTLRADGVKVKLFKQKLVGSVWRDQAVDEKIARSLEDTILTRAREMRVKQTR